MHPRLFEPELLDKLVLRRLGERHDLGAPVQGRCDPRLDCVSERSQPWWERHPPHAAVDVVEPGDPRAARPHGGEERHPVPDLDERVARAVPPHHLAERRAREDHVPPRLAYHPVAVPPRDGRVSRRVRRSHRDLDARLSPQRGDGRGVYLRAAGLGIVEVAPREHAHAPESGAGGEISEPLDNLRGRGWLRLGHRFCSLPRSGECPSAALRQHARGPPGVGTVYAGPPRRQPDRARIGSGPSRAL